MQLYTDVVQTLTGDAVPNARITVVFSSNGASASLFSDNGTTPLPQPVLTDELGTYSFYAGNGTYDITVNRGAQYETKRGVILFDPADFTGGSGSTLAKRIWNAVDMADNGGLFNFPRMHAGYLPFQGIGTNPNIGMYDVADPAYIDIEIGATGDITDDNALVHYTRKVRPPFALWGYPQAWANLANPNWEGSNDQLNYSRQRRNENLAFYQWALVPQLYQNLRPVDTDIFAQDGITSFRKTCQNLATECKKLSFQGQRPVYPFLWPHYFIGTYDNTPIPVDFWTIMMEETYNNFDGFVIWGSLHDENGNTQDSTTVKAKPWYAATQAWLQSKGLL